jgi:hypothetical protein
MRSLVSVVVPAHNPGRYIEPCIRSILRQTLRPDRFEVIFVDDGSTDGTAERLNRLAAEHPHIRAMHIPASGAPGRPRNVGLEAARGEYVQFLDADDELAPRALERLYRMARANDSDIVVGKFASETMVRRQDLFKHNYPATTLEATPALADASMGPTKLFRTAFLRRADITFPEGWRQMEDQLFTLRAYLAARVISILGEEPCYFFNKREDEAHISAELVEPAAHVQHLHQILDEVDAGVRDAQLRRRLASRFYRTEVLARLAGPRFMDAPVAYQAELFEALRGLARDRIEPEIHAGLGAINRIRSRLLLEGDLSGLLAFGRRVDTFVLDARLRRADWLEGRLALEYRATLLRGPGERPLILQLCDGSTFLDPEVADDLVGPLDVTDELGSMRAQLALVDVGTSLEWLIPGRASLTLRAVDPKRPAIRQPRLHGVVEVDPQRVGPGERPLDDGAWDIAIRLLGLGLRAVGPLRIDERHEGTARSFAAPALLGRPPRWVVPRTDHDGTIRIGIGGLARAPASIDEAGRRVLRDGGGLAFALPIVTDQAGVIEAGRIGLTGRNATHELPAVFRGEMAEVVVATSGAVTAARIPPGRYELTAHLGLGGSPGLPLGAAHARADGRLVVLGVAREPASSRLASWARWYASIAEEEIARLRASLRARLVRPARRLVRRGRRALRRLVGGAGA